MIRVHQLCLRAGRFELKDISFELPSGCYAVLMGKTGSGKTSILEAICGLRSITEGSIWLNGVEVSQSDTSVRGIGYVPQDRALFQTMTVEDNLAFGLHLRKWTRQAVTQRVNELTELLGIRHLLKRMPCNLSGGEAQRVSLGRALAIKPTILCLDEPLSALDEDTREDMYALLRSVQQHTNATILHVTHHPGEAERLADLVLSLRDGAVFTKTLKRNTEKSD